MTVDGNSKSLPRGVNLSKVGDDPNKDHDEEKSKNADETPKGKICCLLCRGFISYKNSDRTRFRDHMANEHDVKFDSDVILAVSVMSAREKQHIVAAAMSRLAEIGNNQLPSTAELLLPRPAVPQVPAPAAAVPAALAPAPASRVPVPAASRAAAASPSPSSRGRGGGVSSPSAARGRGSYRGTVIRPQRPAAPQQLAAAAAAGGKAPFNIQNMSISISVVDQTAKCTQCPMTFKNSVLLAEHTKTVHLARFANLGLSITAPGEKRAAGQEAAGAVTQSPGGSSKRARPEAAVRTPPPQRGRGRGRGSPAVGGRVVAHQQQAVKSEPVAAAQQQPSGATSRQQQGDKVDPVIKCNDCAQFIKQSVFKDHKMGHLKEKTAATSVPAAQSNSKEGLSRNDGGGKGRVIQRKEEKQVDYVDLGEVSDEDEITDVTKKKVLEKKLPCPSCDAMFATTMSLKMHMNLSHPVKTEATDTEQLLTEEGEDSDKVRDEMNSLGTSEMLDDLVNFLNEL